MQVNIDIQLTKGQQEAWDLLQKPAIKYLVMRYSRQQGKTIFIELALIEAMMKKSMNIYCSPGYSQGTKIFTDIFNILSNSGLVKKANAATLRIETIFGGVMQCFSLANANAIRGQTVQGLLCIDEAAFVPTELLDGANVWESVLFATIKANIRKNKVLITSTPRGKNNLFYYFHEKCMKKLKGWREIVKTIYDDSLCSAELLEEIKNSINPRAWQEEFLVEFLDSSMTFLQGFENTFVEYLFDFNCDCWGGIDLSGSGSDETIMTLVNKKNQVFQYVIQGNLDQKYQQIAALINNNRHLKAVYCEINGLGQPMFNEIKKLVKKKQIIKEWITTNSSKTLMISELAKQIAQREIFFNKLDKELYKQMGGFVATYSKSGNLILRGYGNTHDDRVLSLSIAVQCKKDANKTGSYNISWLKNIKTYIKH